AVTTEILVIDDDPEIRQLLRTCFEREGYLVSEAGDATEARSALAKGAVSLVTLDLTLGRDDGLSLAREIRANCYVPIVMVSGKGDAVDRIVGLELGADDYLPKPFQPRELLARLRAILRRRGTGTAADKPLRFGRLEIDRAAHTLRVDGEVRTLTGYQFALLVALAENAGRVLSRETLMDKLKGEALEAFDRSIDVHISRIRAAIEDDAKHPRRVITLRGSGYVFAKAQD
ncbi:MAG TPA: response regulator, partial [Dokdonella sp.]